MSYAQVPDVQKEAGRLAGALTSDAEVQRALDDASAAADGLLSAYGLATPLGDPYATALRPTVAKTAAYDLLRSKFAGESGPTAATGLLDRLRDELYGPNGQGGEWGLLMSGKHPAVILIIQEAGGPPQASSFWSDEPDYGMSFRAEDVLSLNPYLLPMFSRLSKF